MEIERKFLLRKIPENLDSYPYHLIEQAYLCVTPVIRIRRQDDEYYLTYKGSGMMSPFAPLLLAEIEFPTEEAANAFQMPDWFLEDVTQDVRYHNSYMSAMHLSQA